MGRQASSFNQNLPDALTQAGPHFKEANGLKITSLLCASLEQISHPLNAAMMSKLPVFPVFGYTAYTGCSCSLWAIGWKSCELLLESL